MAIYYTFYSPQSMKVIASGKYAGMPFSWNNLPVDVPIFPDSPQDIYHFDYCSTGIMDRNIAEKLQSVMNENNTFFTDLMDEYGTECLIFRIE